MAETTSLAITRPTAVDAALAAQLNDLLDPENAWEPAAGAAFLANPDNLLLIATWDGTPAGFLTAYRLQRFDQARAEVFIYEVGVDDAYHRRGIGRALMAACRDWAATVRAAPVWVPAEADDDRANAFYRGTAGTPDPYLTQIYTYD